MEIINENKLEIVPESKVCCKCRKEKPLNEFRKSKSGKFGVHGFCRACHSIDSKEKYEKNKDTRLAQIDMWQQENPHKTYKYSEKWRKKQKKEKRKLKRELKDRPELLDEKVVEKIEVGETPNF